MTTTPVTSITDEHLEEIERDIEECACFAINSIVVEQIITRLREAEKDAARYRWLRDEALNVDDWAPAVVITDGSMIQQCLDGRDLDEEIDTAMQESKNG